MKSIYTIVLLFLCQIILARITPGEGFNELKVGMHKDSIHLLLGNPTLKMSYEGHKQDFKGIGHEPGNFLFFIVGFDVMHEYSNPIHGHEDYPVYRLYFKDNVLMMFSILNFGYKEKVLRTLSIEQKLHIKMTINEIRNIYGAADIIIDNSNNEDHYLYYTYYRKGIIFVVDDFNNIMAIEIFKPFNNDQIREVSKKVFGDLCH